jgi:hypothetical protein
MVLASVAIVIRLPSERRPEMVPRRLAAGQIPVRRREGGA